jgi:hypothetical protein
MLKKINRLSGICGNRYPFFFAKDLIKGFNKLLANKKEKTRCIGRHRSMISIPVSIPNLMPKRMRNKMIGNPTIGSKIKRKIKTAGWVCSFITYVMYVKISLLYKR